MGDLKLDFGFGGDSASPRVTTYIDRTVEVLRDASQLTGSVTKDLGGTDAQARLNSPLYDDTDLQVFSQEMRLRFHGRRAVPVAGRRVLPAVRTASTGRTLPTPGYDALTQALIGVDSSDFNAPPDTPFYSRLTYDFSSSRVFGEATYRFNPQWALTGGLRYYDFDEDRLLTFAGVFADQGYTDEPGSASSDGVSPRVILAFSPNDDVQFTAQVARGFRLGGINDPLNVGLCTADDLVTYSGHPNWDDEEVTNYEIGAKTRFGRRPRHVQCRGVPERDRRPAGDRGCGHLLLAHHPQRARPRSKGAEMELFVRPERELGLRPVGDLRRTRRSPRRSWTAPASRSPAFAKAIACRRRPSCRRRRTVAYNWAMTDRRSKATCASRCSTSALRTRSSPTRSRTSA